MPKKFASQNSKVIEALERKEAFKKEKLQKKAAEMEALESKKWSQGAKDLSKKELEEQKRLEKLEKKKEREALLVEEEKSIGSKKPLLRGSGKSALKKSQKSEVFVSENQLNVEKYAASNLEDAIELLTLATSDSPSGGGGVVSSDKIERHPERRVRSAYAVFEEREMPILKQENPTLRMTQLKQMLQKKWKKSPENPMNQQSIAFNTSKDQERLMIDMQKTESLEKYKA